MSIYIFLYVIDYLYIFCYLVYNYNIFVYLYCNNYRYLVKKNNENRVNIKLIL